MPLVRAASRFFVCAVLTAAAAANASPRPAPQLVSPGNERHEGRVGSECPTFSWAPAQASSGYMLVVYGAPGGAAAARDTSSKPLLEVELPDGALSYSPSLGECLPGAGRYSWAVGVRGEDGEIHWSTPGIFRVIAPLEPAEEEPRQFAPPVDAWLPGSRLPQSLTGEAFSPPVCGGDFTDVTGAICGWVETFAADQIATECAGGKYCPDNPVTRAQFAVFAQRIMRGTDTWRPEAGDGSAPNLPPGAPTITPLDTAGVVGTATSVTIGADGLPLISYWDGANPGGGPKVAHCSNLACSNATITFLEAVGPLGFSSIAIGKDGLGLISYWDMNDLLTGDLKVAHCSNVNCTASIKTPLDTLGNVGWHNSIAIGADGLGLISHYENIAGPDGNLKVAHCADVNCTSMTGPSTALDTTGDVGLYTSIAIGADGLGLISYYDATNGNLKVAHCSNLECTSTTVPPTSLDIPVVVGDHTSVTIGADGLGLISYHDITNGDLKVAHCSNVNCSAATFARVDNAPSVGLFTSITIGADGLGLITYFADPTDDLKVAHCSNVLCAPYFRRR